MGRLFVSLASLGFIWGTSFMFIKILLETLGPAQVVFGRTFFGAVILIAIALARRNHGFSLRKLPYGKLTLIALANNVLPWLLISTSETRISSSLASIINATTPLWTLLIGFLFFSARLRINQWVGALIGFAGIFILSDVNAGSVAGSNISGIFIMSGATLFYGIGSHLTKKYANDIPVLELSLFTLAGASVISFVIMASTGLPEASVFFSLPNVAAFAGLGGLGSGIAYLIYYYLVQKGGPEYASLVTYLAPVFALLLGTVFLSEKITSVMLAGLLIIFAGVYISSLKKKQTSTGLAKGK